MSPAPALSVETALLVGSASLLTGGAVAFRTGRERIARPAAVAGFGLLAGVFCALLVGYIRAGVTDQLFLVLTAGAGVVLTLQAAHLSARDWDRRTQLATTAAAIVLIALPFELYPQLQLLVQESLTGQVVAAADALGYEPAVETTADGHETVLTFENGGYLEVARECTGIDAVALFGGILVGARTTVRRKLGAAVFMLVAVYAVNMIRMVFLVAAMTGDWFGPLFTSTGTVQMTYYVAEMGIGQPFVVLSSVAGFLLVGRWIPDVLAFPNGLLDTFVSGGRGDDRSRREAD